MNSLLIVQQQVTRLVSYVRSVLTKRRLEGFELQVTSVLDLENDSDTDDSDILSKSTSEKTKKTENGISVDNVTGDTNSACKKKKSAYDNNSSNDVDIGISNLEHTVSELISKVGDTIGDSLMKQVNEDDADEGDSKQPKTAESGANSDDEMKKAKSSRKTAAVLSPVLEMICDTLTGDLTPALVRLVLALEMDTLQVI